MGFRKNWLFACAVAAVSMLAFGCGEDGGSTSDPADMTTANDTVTTDQMTTTDTTPTPDGTTAPDTTTTPDTSNPGTEVPIEYPATSAEYMAGKTSYVHTLTVPAFDSETGAECCKDYGDISKDFIENGTNNLDNAFGKLAGDLSAFADLGALISEQVEDGTVVILWDHHELDGPDDADNFVMVGLFGDFEGDTDFTSAKAGNGSFTVSANSFVNGTGEPLIDFNPAVMAGGNMSAGPDQFFLTLPLGIAALDVAVSDAELTGKATISDAGVAYTEGTLTGYVNMTDLLNAVNEITASETCECLGLDGPLYTLEADGTISDKCGDKDAVEAQCPDEEQELCRTLGGGAGAAPIPVCGLLPGLLSNTADLDFDGDGVYDALSIGLEFEASNATVAGVE